MPKKPIPSERRTELMPLSDLEKRLAPSNPKGHDLGTIGASLKRFGAVELPAIDERTGLLVAGNGRVEELAALKAKGKKPPEGVTAGAGDDWFVPITRGWASKNDKEAQGYLVASFRSAENGGWAEGDVLGEILKAQGEDLAGLGFTSAEVTDVLEQLAGPREGGSGERSRRKGKLEDAAAALVESKDDHKPPAKVWVKDGQLFQLGRHRLLCGDSTKAADLERLCGGPKALADAVITDTPYAIYGSSTGQGADVADDRMVRPFFEKVLGLFYDRVRWFAHVYICCDWRTWPAIWDGGKRANLAVKNLICWPKGEEEAGASGLGSMWSQCWEAVGFFTKDPPPKSLKAGKARGQRQVLKPNVQWHKRPAGEARHGHNAAKPVRLLVELVDAATEKGESFLDPFVGSGSTLAVAEEMERTCWAMDVEPKWVQKTIERWEAKTGKKHRVLA